MSAGNRASTHMHSQQYEHLLFGSVSEANLPALLHRLRGLCDYSSSGGVQFTDREITFKLEASNSFTKLRVRQSLDQPDAPWILSYHGQLELGDNARPAAVRTCVQAGCSQNLHEFLKELGFVASTELILKGFVFRKGPLRITVFKMLQLSQESGDVESAQPVFPSHLVELSGLAASGQDALGIEMRNFAEHLKPIVNMEKTDGVR